MKPLRLKIHIFAREFLQFTLITYLVLILAETVKEGFVSYFFNVHILLLLIGALGAIVVFTYQKGQLHRSHTTITFLDVTFSILLAAAGALLMYDRTIALGPIAFVIVGVSALIIIFFSLLLLTDSEAK